MSFWLNKRVGGSILHKIGLRVLVINNEESDSDCLVFPEQVQCVVGHLNLEFMGIKDKTRFLELTRQSRLVFACHLLSRLCTLHR